jgi:hypothetical protein
MEIRDTSNYEEQRQLREIQKTLQINPSDSKNKQIIEGKQVKSSEIPQISPSIIEDSQLNLLIYEMIKRIVQKSGIYQGLPIFISGAITLLTLVGFSKNPQVTSAMHSVTQGIHGTLQKTTTLNEIKEMISEATQVQKDLLREQTMTEEKIRTEIIRTNKMLTTLGNGMVEMRKERNSITLGIKAGIQIAGPKIFGKGAPTFISAHPMQPSLNQSGANSQNLGIHGSSASSVGPSSTTSGPSSTTLSPSPLLGMMPGMQVLQSTSSGVNTNPFLFTGSNIQVRPVIELYFDYKIPLWQIDGQEILEEMKNKFP